MTTRLEAEGLLNPPAGEPPVVFAYSYGALEILRTAKRAGCMTVLCQIDGGPEEDTLVAGVARAHQLEDEGFERPPKLYWDNWRAECALADVIVVNSRWSALLLERAGVDSRKLQVIPLIYDAKNPPSGRTYPHRFTAQRPLRLLFLGQFGVRKGAVELLDAMAALQGAPVELFVVGTIEPVIRRRYAGVSQVNWVGPVPRSAASQHYRAADLFVLPTHSDGFAITQLEAVAHGLPMLVSKQCGEVVEDQTSGLVLAEVSSAEIASKLIYAVDNPRHLEDMSARTASLMANFSPERIGDQFETLLRRRCS